MYLDAAYVAKFYVEEPDAPAIRAIMRRAQTLTTSAWSVAEVTCALHRHLRQRNLDARLYRDLLDSFREHTETGFWTPVPVTEAVLARMQTSVEALPADVYLRAGDAVHLASAAEIGEREIWTSDRHLLSAAPHFGLTGRSA